MPTVEFYPLTHAFIKRALQETVDQYVPCLLRNAHIHGHCAAILDHVSLCHRTMARCDAADAPPPPQAIWDDFNAEKAELGRKWKREIVGIKAAQREWVEVRKTLEATERQRVRALEGKLKEGEIEEWRNVILGSALCESWERDIDDLGKQYERWDAHIELQKTDCGDVGEG